MFVNKGGYLIHKYLDGIQWLPKDDWEFLGADLVPSENIAATVRGSNRIHVVGQNLQGVRVHKYYDGTTWKPEGHETTENLGSDNFDREYFESGPGIDSWGPDRLDIFGVLSNGTLMHKSWDGSQ